MSPRLSSCLKGVGVSVLSVRVCAVRTVWAVVQSRRPVFVSVCRPSVQSAWMPPSTPYSDCGRRCEGLAHARAAGRWPVGAFDTRVSERDLRRINTNI